VLNSNSDIAFDFWLKEHFREASIEVEPEEEISVCPTLGGHVL
jgi:hypothetical protein